MYDSVIAKYAKAHIDILEANAERLFPTMSMHVVFLIDRKSVV